MRGPRLFVALLLMASSAGACQSSELELSSTEQLNVIVSTASTDFGSVQVGQTSPVKYIYVSPAGINASYDTITTVTESCPDFSVNAPGLPTDVYRECEPTCGQYLCFQAAPPQCIPGPEQSYSFSATYRPTVPGPVSCVITISGSSPKTITLYGTGTVPPVDVDVQPGSVAFGDVRLGTASTGAQLSVRNIGGTTMQVSSVSVSSGFVITSGPTGAYAVPPNGSQPYSVTCNPSTVGAVSGQFRVTSNDQATPTLDVPLSCRGVDSNLDISPSPAAVPTTRVGEPTERTISLVNSGTAPMAIADVQLSTTDGLTMVAAPPAGTVLAPGASTTARVAFDATASGDAAGSLVVSYDNGQSRSVEISARALGTSMALNPDGNVDLGPICVGQSKSQPITIVANDEASFVVTELSALASPFGITAPSLPATVQGSAANQVSFEVAASPELPGPTMSTLVVTTDIPGSPQREIQLSALGLPEGVSGTPESIFFGSAELDTTTLGLQAIVTNCSNEDVTLTSPRIEGIDASEFAIVLPPSSMTIPPAQNASWLIVASPRTVGARQAAFVVDHPAGTVTIALESIGLGEGTGDTDDAGRASYYACSAGTGSAAWPLGIALALLVRRRRATARARA